MRVTVGRFAFQWNHEVWVKSAIQINWFKLAAFLISVPILAQASPAAIVVRSEQSVYIVQPGETFDIRIHIDGNDQTLGNVFEPVPSGLFSYGVRATFPSGSALVSSVAQLTPVAQLNFFGLAPGALQQVSSTSASSKGNIDPFSGVAHSNSLLLTIQLSNLAPASSSYLVQLDEWRTLGAGEQIFITGSGAVLDTSPSSNLFLSALIVVVPEPSALSLLFLSAACAFGTRQRRRFRCGRASTA